MQRDEQRGALGDRFESFGAEPSAGLWDSIVDALDQKKKRKAIIWWWFGSGIAAIGILFILFVQPSKSNFEQTGDNARLASDALHQHQQLSAQAPTHSKKLTATKLKASNLKSTQTNVSSFAANQGAAPKLNPNNQPNERGTNPPNRPDIEIGYAVTMDQQTIEKVSRIPLVEVEELLIPKMNPALIIGDVAELDQHKWELGFGVSTWTVSNRLLSDINYQNNNSELIVDLELGTADLTELTADLYVKADRTLAFNFYAGYRVRPHLRITSGLQYETTNYSIRDSENKVYDAGDFQVYNELTVDQNLYYRPTKITSVSVPIGLDWDFFGTRRIRFGTGLSILNEFPILEQSLSVSPLSFEGGSTPTKARISGYHFGTGVNLIASYFLTERFRIQLNPGIRGYWFQKTNASDLIPHRRLWYGGSLNLIWNI
jgi:hypothetical protein